jgi:hypothetical protein
MVLVHLIWCNMYDAFELFEISNAVPMLQHTYMSNFHSGKFVTYVTCIYFATLFSCSL